MDLMVPKYCAVKDYLLDVNKWYTLMEEENYFMSFSVMPMAEPQTEKQ